MGVVRVWRGQGDCDWPLHPSLYRRLLATTAPEEVSEELVRAYELDMLCEANGFGYYKRGRLPTLVRIQHYGGATRLLDVTRDPLVALWFATDPRLESRDGAVFQFEVPLESTLVEGTLDTLDELDSRVAKTGAGLFFPMPDEKRVVAQRAGFVVPSIKTRLSDGEPLADGLDGVAVTRTLVPGEAKATLRRYLARSAGISARSLFPGIAGYALSNSVSEPFARSADELHDGSNGIFPGRGLQRAP